MAMYGMNPLLWEPSPFAREKLSNQNSIGNVAGMIAWHVRWRMMQGSVSTTRVQTSRNRLLPLGGSDFRCGTDLRHLPSDRPPSPVQHPELVLEHFGCFARSQLAQSLKASPSHAGGSKALCCMATWFNQVLQQFLANPWHLQII